jgi:hypothetical protein
MRRVNWGVFRHNGAIRADAAGHGGARGQVHHPDHLARPPRARARPSARMVSAPRLIGSVTIWLRSTSAGIRQDRRAGAAARHRSRPAPPGRALQGLGSVKRAGNLGIDQRSAILGRDHAVLRGMVRVATRLSAGGACGQGEQQGKPIRAASAHLRGGGQHLVGGGDDLGVQLIAALGLDQFGDLAHRIDRAFLKIALPQGAKPIEPGCRPGRPRGGGFEKQVRPDRLEPLFVGKAGQGQLAQQFGFDPVGEIGIDLARGVDRDAAGVEGMVMPGATA